MSFAPGSGEGLEWSERLQDQELSESKTSVSESGEEGIGQSAIDEKNSRSNQFPPQQYHYPSFPQFPVPNPNSFSVPYPMRLDSGSNEAKDCQTFPMFSNVDIPCPPFANATSFPPMVMSVPYPYQSSNFPVLQTNQALPYSSFAYSEYKNDSYGLPAYPSQNPIPYASPVQYVMASTPSMPFLGVSPRSSQSNKHHSYRYHSNKDSRQRDGQHNQYNSASQSSHHRLPAYSGKGKQQHSRVNRNPTLSAPADQSVQSHVPYGPRPDRVNASRSSRKLKTSGNSRNWRGDNTQAFSSASTSSIAKDAGDVANALTAVTTSHGLVSPKNTKPMIDVGSNHAPESNSECNALASSATIAEEVARSPSHCRPTDSCISTEGGGIADMDALSALLAAQYIDIEEYTLSMGYRTTKCSQDSTDDCNTTSVPLPKIEIFEGPNDGVQSSSETSSPTTLSTSDTASSGSGLDQFDDAHSMDEIQLSTPILPLASAVPAEPSSITPCADPDVIPTPSTERSIGQHRSFYKATGSTSSSSPIAPFDIIATSHHADREIHSMSEMIEGVITENDTDVEERMDSDMDASYDSVFPEHLEKLLERPEAPLEEFSLELSRDSTESNVSSEGDESNSNLEDEPIYDRTEPLSQDNTLSSSHQHTRIVETRVVSHQDQHSTYVSQCPKPNESIKRWCPECALTAAGVSLNMSPTNPNPDSVSRKRSSTSSLLMTNDRRVSFSASPGDDDSNDNRDPDTATQGTPGCRGCLTASASTKTNIKPFSHTISDVDPASSPTQPNSSESPASPSMTTRTKHNKPAQYKKKWNSNRRKKGQSQSNHSSRNSEKQQSSHRRPHQQNHRNYRMGERAPYVQNAIPTYGMPEYLHQHTLVPYHAAYPLPNPYLPNGSPITYYPMHQQPVPNSYFGFQ